MTNFSTNQVMQFYALDGERSISPVVKPYTFEKACKILFTDGDEKYTSDKIENVMWGKVVTADALKGKVVTATIDFDTSASVVAGEDYVVRVSYPEVGGAGIESWTTKTAVVHASSTDTKTTILTKLKDELVKIFAVDGILTASIDSVTNKLEITPNLTIRYERGIRPVVIPEFKVTVNQITVDGDLVNWVALDKNQQIPTVAETSTIPTGYKVADMEYFAMGERADEYRMVGYPDYVKTNYVVTPNADYNMLVVHFAYKGANSDSHKSEKDLIIVAKSLTNLETVAKAIEAATGVAFTKVSVSSGTKSEALLTPAEEDTEA